MEEQWQLYDEQGLRLAGRGGSKDEVFSKGLLHGAAHVWIWRRVNNSAEVLLQKRASNKRTWPDRYDISAAGHIDLGEEPLTAAIRETTEEIGLTVDKGSLRHIGVHRAYLVAPGNSVENEFQWLYLFELVSNKDFNLQLSEVASVEWKTLEAFSMEILGSNNSYVPHGGIYYQTIIKNIEALSKGVAR